VSAPSHFASEIHRLVGLFLQHCDDRETLFELESIAANQHQWHEGHALFQRIRSKTLVAERSRDSLKTKQYCFEEVCAKTLYNLSGCSAPFDSDSPDWISPNAVALAKALGISDPSLVAGP
jgi:hypothetical protein